LHEGMQFIFELHEPTILHEVQDTRAVA